MNKEFIPSREALDRAGLSQRELRIFKKLHDGITFGEYVKRKTGMEIATFAFRKGARAQYEVVIRNSEGKFDDEFAEMNSQRYHFLSEENREAFINHVYDEFERHVQKNGFKIAAGELRKTREGLTLYVNKERCPPIPRLIGEAPSRVIKFSPGLK